MGSVLKRLFDYQRFENEPSLQKVIDNSLRNPVVVQLSDDDLEMVAAGTELDDTYDTDIVDSYPVICDNCQTVNHIKLGQKSYQCQNKNCGKVHIISG